MGKIVGYLIRKISGFMYGELYEYIMKISKYRNMIINAIESNNSEKAADIILAFLRMEMICVIDRTFRKKTKLLP